MLVWFKFFLLISIRGTKICILYSQNPVFCENLTFGALQTGISPTLETTNPGDVETTQCLFGFFKAHIYFDKKLPFKKKRWNLRRQSAAIISAPLHSLMSISIPTSTAFICRGNEAYMCVRVCAHAVGIQRQLWRRIGYRRARSSSEELHSQRQDTDKERSRATMNPSSVRALWLLSLLCLSPSPSLLQAFVLSVRKLWRQGGGGEPRRLSKFNQEDQNQKVERAKRNETQTCPQAAG